MGGDPAPRLNSAGKVAIPALRPQTDSSGSASNPVKARRTAKACAECKLKKIKCSGKRPACDYCQLCQIPCTYPDGRRERNRKVAERSDRLLQLLGEASSLTSLPPHILNELRALESEVVDDDQSLASPTNTAAKKRPGSPSGTGDEEKRPRTVSPKPQTPGEADAAAGEVGSEDSVDVSAEDFNRSEQSKATGFVGKHSEVSWAQRLAKLQVENTENAQVETTEGVAEKGKAIGDPKDPSITNFSYHQDNDDSTLKLNHVEKDELPPIELATLLVECYMDNVHEFLPILIKPDFASQFRSCVRSENPISAPPAWRAILNMVFAIGAKFSHLIGAPWRGDERDHLLYHTRALQLSPLNEDTVVLPDLQRIQMMALTSFYYLAVGHVSRSWIMLGLACRHAEALGLHLRSIAPSLTAASREKRARVWWSLYYLEYLLCENTGRPTMISPQFCSVQPLAPLNEIALTNSTGNKQIQDWYMIQNDPSAKNDSRRLFLELEIAPSPVNHFRSRVDLAVVTQKIFANLYSAATISKSWQRTQTEIVTLSKDVDQWYRALPRAFQFAHELLRDKGAFTRERIILGFCFYSAKMLLNRPCLCRVDVRIQHQTPGSKDIDQERARECIMAARTVADLLPDAADPAWLYTHGPWWCIVHYLMQAVAILMLELGFGEFHLRGWPLAAGSADITAVVGKLVRWLSAMAATGNPAAAGACRQVRRQFEGFMPFRELKVAALFRDIDFGPAVGGAGRHGAAAGQPRPQPSGGVQEQGDARMQYVSSEGVVYGAPPPSVGQQVNESFTYLGLPFLPEQQFTFGEPWDVSDEMVDWNDIFFNNPYDVYNPFLHADQAAEGQNWTGGGDDGGFAEGVGFGFAGPQGQQQEEKGGQGGGAGLLSE